MSFSPESEKYRCQSFCWCRRMSIVGRSSNPWHLLRTNMEYTHVRIEKKGDGVTSYEIINRMKSGSSQTPKRWAAKAPIPAYMQYFSDGPRIRTRADRYVWQCSPPGTLYVFSDDWGLIQAPHTHICLPGHCEWLNTYCPHGPYS